ncbi:MAG: nicotinamide-nucleotide amidohydrolase family protein [Bacteriovoracaceae bacterium]|nr:nicotinamide-nucleotide amidohydrolase family protein [Bacteriovoracaceae bacterium]
MKVEFIGIGSELLYGRVSDSNGPWLASFCSEYGFELQGITICNDTKESITEVVMRGLNRSDILFISGGLGPTEDDMTKKVLSEIFKEKVEQSVIAEKIVASNYERLNKSWTPDWNHYHFIPTHFIPFDNPKGLAPGLGYKTENSMLFCAPGVPKEFRSMVKDVFFPYIVEKTSFKAVTKKQITVRTHSVPEEVIFNELAPNLWKDLSKVGSLSSLPQTMGIDLVLTLPSDSNFENSLEEVKNIINKTELHKNVWQWGNISLEEFIIQTFNNQNLTFSFAESCTGGLSGHRMTDVPGSSSSFLGSCVTYSNSSKNSILNVPNKLIDQFGAVSTEVAKEMANGGLKKFDSDISISWSGIAGPTGGTKSKPVGTLALGWATKDGISGSEIFNYNGNRDWLKKRFSEKGLFKLLELSKSFK